MTATEDLGYHQQADDTFDLRLIVTGRPFLDLSTISAENSSLSKGQRDFTENLRRKLDRTTFSSIRAKR